MIIAACAIILSGTMPAAAAAPTAEKIEQNVKKAATKTVTFNVSMHCKNCVKKINDNVAFEKGVKDSPFPLTARPSPLPTTLPGPT